MEEAAGVDPASGLEVDTVEDGFGGSDGCTGEATATGVGWGDGSVLTSVVSRLPSRDWGGGTVASAAGRLGAAVAAAAFVRAWAIRSAVLASVFLRMSIRASSCLIFFT